MKYLFTIQGPEGDKTVQMALADPERFVLKPQLEGGGRAFSFITTLALFKILKFFIRNLTGDVYPYKRLAIRLKVCRIREKFFWLYNRSLQLL